MLEDDCGCRTEAFAAAKQALAAAAPPARPAAAPACQQEQVRPAAAHTAEHPSSFAKGIKDLSSRLQPTNYNMLLFRTLNRDLCLPNSNDDYIAPLFRDRLMPIRSWLSKCFPSLVGVTRRGVENPAVGVPGVCNFVDARTKWLDEALKQALEEKFTQVVCIAAGFDTRAYRFSRPGVKFFEVDLPTASRRKQQLVDAVLPGPAVLPRPTYIAADLSKVTLDVALAGTGFQRGVRTLFTCEGLLYYLPEAAVATLLASVADIAAPGSRLLFDFLHADAQDGSTFYPGYGACAESVAVKGETFISGLEQGEDAMAAYLAPLNWQLRRVWSPRQMVAAQLPHEVWSEDQPPICSYYSYCEVEKAGPAPAAAAAAKAAVKAARLPGSCVEDGSLQRQGSLIQAAAGKKD